MTAIFFYGSLMDERIRRNVFADSIREEQIVTARAEGFRTMVYPGESFPVLVPAADNVVTGLVLLEASAEALERMAFYEGDLYWLDELEVITADGARIQARYNRANEQDLLLEEEWCFQRWQAAERDAMIRTSELYMAQCWGKMDDAEADVVWRELQARHRGTD
jgi:gamma-glutamylcyclotransferase (GGCT)/AIG2-like uncharacterized protein YtfP